MLFGTDAWEVNFSSSRGFFMVCAGCGTNNKIKVYPELTNVDILEDSDAFVTGAYQMYVIIECEECDQVVRVNPDQTSVILKETTHVG